MTKRKGRAPGSRNGEYSIKRSPEEAEKLFTENRGLVAYTIRLKRIKATEDTFQDGYLGLWMAALCFDDTQGRAFSGYAVPAIWGSIVRTWQGSKKSIEPDYSLDHLITPNGKFDDPESGELYTSIRSSGADLDLKNAETSIYLHQMLTPVEAGVVRMRMDGMAYKEINAAFSKKRGWSANQIKSIRKKLEEDYRKG